MTHGVKSEGEAHEERGPNLLQRKRAGRARKWAAPAVLAVTIYLRAKRGAPLRFPFPLLEAHFWKRRGAGAWTAAGRPCGEMQRPELSLCSREPKSATAFWSAPALWSFPWATGRAKAPEDRPIDSLRSPFGQPAAVYLPSAVFDPLRSGSRTLSRAFNH